MKVEDLENMEYIAYRHLHLYSHVIEQSESTNVCCCNNCEHCQIKGHMFTNKTKSGIETDYLTHNIKRRQIITVPYNDMFSFIIFGIFIWTYSNHF